MNYETYVRSLVDPFNTTIDQPKFLDGRVDRTSGLRLRQTGTITCKTTGYTYIGVAALVNNSVFWQAEGSSDDPLNWANNAPPSFTGFAENETNRLMQQGSRALAAGVRFSLLNAADANDGMWEAIRIPAFSLDPGYLTEDTPGFVGLGTFEAACTDMANNPTYETGRIRDLHKFMFRLNYRNHELSYAAPVSSSLGHRHFDVIVIRLRGRQVSGEPTLLAFDSVALKEVEYVPGSVPWRLMTYNSVIPNIDELPNKLNLRLPGMRVS